MPFALLNLVVITATVASVAILAFRVILLRRNEVGSWLIAGICLAVICNQVLSRQEFGPFEATAERLDLGAWVPILNLVRNTAPGLFMIQAYRLFVDDGPFPRWLWLAFAFQLFLEALAFASPARAFFGAAPAALELLFGGLALYWTLADWPADLVETRRKARAIVLVLVAVNMIAPILFLRLIALPGAWSFYLHTALSVFIACIAAVLVIVDGEKREGGLVEVRSKQPRESRSAEAAGDAAALHRLQQLMDVDHLYLEPELKLPDLAKHMGMPEYRLRRLIHVRLGHRNFNTFLHALRITEACKRLRDPAERRTPVLTIALSVGYGSINSFNRGFRAIMNCSPSDYRAGSARVRLDPNPEISPQILQSADV